MKLTVRLKTSSRSANLIESGAVFYVVVRKSPPVWKYFVIVDESLFMCGSAYFVLNLSFDVFNGVSWLDLEGDGFTSDGLDDDLHTTSEPGIGGFFFCVKILVFLFIRLSFLSFGFNG